MTYNDIIDNDNNLFRSRSGAVSSVFWRWGRGRAKVRDLIIGSFFSSQDTSSQASLGVGWHVRWVFHFWFFHLANMDSETGEPAGSEERGLIINQKFAHRFFSENKVWELKSSQCRCVKVGEPFWIVESGIGHNTNGLAVFRVLGKVTYHGHKKVTWEELQNEASYPNHRCTGDEIKALMTQWKNKANIYAWTVSDAEVLAKPVYIRRGHQDCRGPLTQTWFKSSKVWCLRFFVVLLLVSSSLIHWFITAFLQDTYIQTCIYDKYKIKHT